MNQESSMPGQDLLLEQPMPPVKATGTSVCGGALALPMARADAEQRAALLKSVADPVRLQLLSIIASSPSQEACVCDMTDAVGVSQPTVSHHLKVLVDAGLLTRQRRGTWAWYAMVPGRLADITGIFG